MTYFKRAGLLLSLSQWYRVFCVRDVSLLPYVLQWFSKQRICWEGHDVPRRKLGHPVIARQQTDLSVILIGRIPSLDYGLPAHARVVNKNVEAKPLSHQVLGHSVIRQHQRLYSPCNELNFIVLLPNHKTPATTIYLWMWRALVLFPCNLPTHTNQAVLGSVPGGVPLAKAIGQGRPHLYAACQLQDQQLQTAQLPSRRYMRAGAYFSNISCKRSLI